MAEHRPFPRRSSPGHPPGAGLPRLREGMLTAAFDLQTSRSSRTLHLRTPPTGSLASLQLSSRQQRRRLRPLEPRRHRRLQVLKHRSPLLRARRDHRPDPFAPAVSPFTPRPLRDQAVDHHEPDRLLRQVVRRLHSRRRDEPEITLPMLLEPLRQVATGSRRRHVVRPAPQHLGPRRFQLALELRSADSCSRRWITPKSSRNASRNRSP